MFGTWTLRVGVTWFGMLSSVFPALLFLFTGSFPPITAQKVCCTKPVVEALEVEAAPKVISGASKELR